MLPFVLALCATACGSSSSNGSASVPSPTPAAVAPPQTLGPIQTIVELTSGKSLFAVGGSAFALAFGQSITVPQSHSFGGPRFTWLDDKGNAMPAAGHMAIFVKEFLGPPTFVAVVQYDPGNFLARSITTEGAEFVFDDGVILDAGAKYWFLADTEDPKGRYITLAGADTYTGGDLYYGGPGAVNYSRVTFDGGPQQIDGNFRLSGKQILP